MHSLTHGTHHHTHVRTGGAPLDGRDHPVWQRGAHLGQVRSLGPASSAAWALLAWACSLRVKAAGCRLTAGGTQPTEPCPHTAAAPCRQRCQRTRSPCWHGSLGPKPWIHLLPLLHLCSLERVLMRHEMELSKSDRALRIVRVDFGDGSLPLIGARASCAWDQAAWGLGRGPACHGRGCTAAPMPTAPIPACDAAAAWGPKPASALPQSLFPSCCMRPVPPPVERSTPSRTPATWHAGVRYPGHLLPEVVAVLSAQQDQAQLGAGSGSTPLRRQTGATVGMPGKRGGIAPQAAARPAP